MSNTNQFLKFDACFQHVPIHAAQRDSFDGAASVMGLRPRFRQKRIREK